MAFFKQFWLIDIFKIIHCFSRHQNKAQNSEVKFNIGKYSYLVHLWYSSFTLSNVKYIEVLNEFIDFSSKFQVLDKYFGSVCELDIIFNFEKAYFILDELLMAGEIQDTSKKSVLKQIEFADSYQEEEIISLALKDVGLI